MRSLPIQTGARSGTLSRVAIVPCEFPCRSQIPSFAWLLEVTCQAANTPPDGAAAGKLPPGTTRRTGAFGVLISQMSVVAGAAAPETVAVAAGAAPGPTAGFAPGRGGEGAAAAGPAAVRNGSAVPPRGV